MTPFDVTSVVVSASTASTHTHSSSNERTRLWAARQRLREWALESNASALELRQRLYSSVDQETAKLLPSEQTMTMMVFRTRKIAKQKKLAAASLIEKL